MDGRQIRFFEVLGAMLVVLAGFALIPFVTAMICGLALGSLFILRTAVWLNRHDDPRDAKRPPDAS